MQQNSGLCLHSGRLCCMGGKDCTLIYFSSWRQSNILLFYSVYYIIIIILLLILQPMGNSSIGIHMHFVVHCIYVCPDEGTLCTLQTLIRACFT